MKGEAIVSFLVVLFLVSMFPPIVKAQGPSSVTITPSSDTIDLGQSTTWFVATVSGGTSPYTYQFYLNGVAWGSATISSHQQLSTYFTPGSAGIFIVSVSVMDAEYFIVNSSNTATVTVNSPPIVNISPTNVTLYTPPQQQFTSSVSGGSPPYSYQWCVNGTIVSGATSPTWTFAPSLNSASYSVYLNVTDNAGVTVESNTASVTVIRTSIIPLYDLTVISAHGNPSPGVGTDQYLYGNVTCSVTSPVVESGVSYTCTGWTGTGDVPSSGSGTSVTFTISQNSTITWNWNVTQWTLAVSSAHDSPSPSVGNNVYSDGSLVTCSITSPVTEGGIVWTCTGWSGTGSVPSGGAGTSVTFTITQGSTITWNWQGTGIQWTLAVSSAHDSPSPSVGNHLYSNGSSVTCSVTSPVVEGGVSYTCTGWSGTGSVPSSGVGTSVTFTISQNSTITWNWNVTQVYYSLTVNVVGNGTVTENPFNAMYLGGTVVALTAVPGLNWTFAGWSGGLVSSQNPVNITMTANKNVTATFSVRATAAFISVGSQYSGYFLQDLKLMNTFSVYTNISGTLPVQVYGIIGGTQYTFSNSSTPGGPYTVSVNMGSLQPNSSLAVSAVYSDGTVLNATYPLKIIETPSWLISLINTATSTNINAGNNTYTVYLTKDFDLPDIFNMNISALPNFAGGGSFTLLPTISVEFTFSSDGTLSISCPLNYQTPYMNFGAACVEAHVTLSASGNFVTQNNSIEWVNATLSFDVEAYGSATVPIAGLTFDGTTIGFSATVSVDANFAASLVLAPTQNASQELISGIEVMIQSISGQITFGLGLAVNASIGIATITGGGSVDFTVYLKPTQPYVSGGTVTGTVSITYQAFWFWHGTIWSDSGLLYEWGSDPYLNLASSSNFAVMPRYYNTTDYEGFVWPTGVWNGTAIQDIYPFTRMSASSNGDNAYILYTTDNVSLPEQSGLSLTGLEFDSNQRTLKRLVMPSVSNEIFFNPVVTTLPNGTLLAMWDSIPLSETSSATSPFDINTVIPQYSYFDTQTENWSLVRNLTETGVANSYQLSSDSTGSYALVLEADSIFSTNQYLVEYNVQSDSELLNMSVANVTNMISFNSLSHVAALQLVDGSYELVNLSSSGLTALPSMTGYEIKDVQLTVNSTDSLGILYGNSNSSLFSLYNISSNAVSFSMNVSQSTTYLTLIHTAPGYYLITSDSSGITSYFIEGQSEKSLFYPLENITSMGATITDDSILVYTTENYGNSSYPLLNLTLTSIPRVGTGDLNNDGIVSLADLVILAQAYGSKPGDTNWNINADIDNNGAVGLSDLVILAQHYGQHVPRYLHS